MQLVIVESPTKAKTIGKFLGPKYKVLSSYGHVRDLPKSELGVDLENQFQPKYVIPTKARKNVNILKKEAKNSDLVILATDEDREGEAIAYHLAFILELNGEKEYKRIVFHEITKPAIKGALDNPRKIDEKLVNAQQARRILDRIVGYELSPFLWEKIARKLSAGRVQSVAVRLVVEREREIEKFVPEEYWQIIATLKKIKEINEFEVFLIKKDGKVISKMGIKNKNEADKIIKDLGGAKYEVSNIEKKEIKRNPLPPFTTSTLQQAAWKKLRFPAKLTMSVAQNLYERGLITYHRTDSLNLSELSLSEAKKFIIKEYGKNYWAGSFRRFKTKTKGAQEAHEAIRPAYPDKQPGMEKLDPTQLKLYDLIWRRFIASQISPAIFDSTTVDVSAKNYMFRATGQILKFDGFLKLYPLKYEETELPLLKINEILKLVKLDSSQHFTEPPARYNEATLIKILEEKGVGRPSTYAPILSTIQERNYIEKDENKKFKPTEMGIIVNDMLVEHFPEIVDVNFTAKMEEKFDDIAQGTEKYVKVLSDFYGPFLKNLEIKKVKVAKKDFNETPTDKKCPKCGANIIIRFGRFGKFYACSDFPKCKYTESIKNNKLGFKCPKCDKGEVVEKRTKRKRIFYGCSNYPDCDFASWDKPVDERCKKCNSIMVQKKKGEIKCSNKECK